MIRNMCWGLCKKCEYGVVAGKDFWTDDKMYKCQFNLKKHHNKDECNHFKCCTIGTEISCYRCYQAYKKSN